MGRISKTDREKCWNDASKIRGENPNLWRRDEMGNAIYKPSYGLGGNHGWSIDHRNPISEGGTDNPRNLRVLHTETNELHGRRPRLRGR
jgi:hypothetical protein